MISQTRFERRAWAVVWNLHPYFRCGLYKIRQGRGVPTELALASGLKNKLLPEEQIGRISVSGLSGAS